MSNYTPTTIADVLAHVGSLKADAEFEARGLKAEGESMTFGSSEYQFNDLCRRRVEGELLAIARIEGYLEARIQIDEIYGHKTTREILEGNLQYDLGRPE